MDDWAELHGYDYYHCGYCGWSGITDSPVCEQCDEGQEDPPGFEVPLPPVADPFPPLEIPPFIYSAMAWEHAEECLRKLKELQLPSK